MDPSDVADADLIARALEGDTAAFGGLVERYQEAAFRAAYLIVRDGMAAEDVAQDAFVRAYRGLGSFRRDAPFRPWLLRIVTNLALNEARRRRRQYDLAARVARLVGRDPQRPDEAAERSDHAASLARAVAELSRDDRLVLLLRYFLDLPEAEIAAVIGRPRGTVKSRLHRAARRLRAVIERRYPGLRERFDA